MKIAPVVTLVALLFVPAEPAQAGSEVALLFPFDSGHLVQGAYGSIWATESFVHNGGTLNISLLLPPTCQLGACAVLTVRPGETVSLPQRQQNDPGAFMLWIDPITLPALSASLRVRDVSRGTESWGYEVPVVPETRAFSGTMHLLNVPSTHEHRATLRLYQFGDGSPTQFSVRVYDIRTQVLLKQFEVAAIERGEQGDPYPPTATIFDLTHELEGVVFRVEVEANDPESRFWGFVSATNNHTQAISILTPSNLTSP